MKTIIKDLRTAAGLTQRGEYNPSLVLAYKIARLFNTTVEELCCLKENVTLEEGQHEDQR